MIISSSVPLLITAPFFFHVRLGPWTWRILARDLPRPVFEANKETLRRHSSAGGRAAEMKLPCCIGSK